MAARSAVNSAYFCFYCCLCGNKMSAITFESLLKECDLDEKYLNSEIEREHFPQISRSLTDWRVLALKLPEFREGVVSDIKAIEGREEYKRLEFLKQLKQKLSFKATYGLLVRNLLEIERTDDARNLCCHLKSLCLIGSKGDREVATAQLEKLKKEDEELENKFDKVVQVVQASLLKRDVVLSEILSSLQFIKSHKEKKMVKQQFKELLETQSLHVLFFTFSDIWNYMYPGLLEFIVERFGTASDIKTFQEYKEDLEKYRRKVKLGDYVKIYKKTNPPLYNKKLSTVVGDDWRCKTLQDLEDVRLEFADKTKCDKMILRALPHESQFTIVFSMPSWVQLNLVELYPVLSTIGATKVYLNNDYIYECVPLKKEADDYRKGEKLQYFQSDLSKERISHFPHISDSDLENLIKKISASLNEKDVKAIEALRCGYSCHNDPRGILLQMLQDGEIIKCAPSNFQSVFKKIERMDVIPIIDDFYKNYIKPNTITEDIIDHLFKSLNIFLKSIQHSLWDLEVDYKTASLASLSSELENIFYQAYNMNESIQITILEFSGIEPIEQEVMKFQKLEAEVVTRETKVMNLQELEAEATEQTKRHRLKELRTELFQMREHLRSKKKRKSLIFPWDERRSYMKARVIKQERKIMELLGEAPEIGFQLLREQKRKIRGVSRLPSKYLTGSGGSQSSGYSSGSGVSSGSSYFSDYPVELKPSEENLEAELQQLITSEKEMEAKLYQKFEPSKRKRGISEEIKTATKKPKVTFSEANGSKTSPLRGSKASPLQRSKASPLQHSKFSRLQRCKGPAKLHCPVCRKKDCGKCVHCRYHSNHQACLRKPRNKCITYFQPYLKRTSQGMCAAKAFDKCNPSTDLKVNIKAIEPVVKIASSSLTPALETPSKAATVVFPIKTEKANTLATLYYNPLATISSKQETDSTVSNPFQISTGDYQVNETSSVLQINKDLSSIIFSMNSNLEDLKCFQGKLNKCLFDQLSGNIKSDKGMSKLQSYETSGEANITSLKDELKEKSDDVTMAKLYPEPAHVAFSEELQTDHSSAEYFHRVVKESISQLSVNLYITKCGISGPPSTGKTHFRELLLGRRRPSQRQSTALSTSAVEVINADLVSTTKRKSGAFKWTVLEKDPWMRLLANTIYEDLLKKGILKEKLNWSEVESTFNSLADFSKNVLLHLSSNVKKNKEGNKSAGEKSALKTLSGRHLLYLVDTGGQPQFHEILPHFLRSSIYFLVHNLSEDLMHCPEFEYTIDDCHYSVPEAMKMSNKSIIEQAARSACSTYHTDVFSKRTPAVAVIGMFKDKCDDVDKTLHKKSKEIKEVLMPLTGSKTKCDIIEYSRDQCIFPFDASEKSWNKNGNILESLKNKVDMYAHGDPSDIKLSHFIFLQNLKKIGKKEPFIMIHKCEDIARNSYVPLENQEMYEALHLFHEVNLILYFRESKEVNDLVFLDPNYLFQMVTDIIVQSFDKPFETNEDFQKSGTFTRALLLNIPRMRELGGKPDSKFSLDKLLCILQQLCIISKLPDASYFMPCVLQMENPQNPTPECTRRLDDIQKRMKKNHVSGPLIISFGDRVLPRGLFCAMVVILSNNYGWQLKTDSESICRRNLIEFSVDNTESGSSSQDISLASTVIFDKITHIQVLTTCPSDNCFLISQALELALYEACKILKYNPANFGIERGFNCNIGHSSTNHHTVVSKNTNKKFVQKCCKNLMGRGKLLEREHLVWFHSNKEYPKEVEIENFCTLVEDLVPNTNQWENIGVHLELTATELDRIRIDYHNEKSRFRRVLEIWKKRGSPPYTWNTIIDVLNSPLVKEHVLAEELATKYYS